MTFATFETILRGAPSALMGRVKARGTVPTSPRAHGRFHLATRLRPWSKRTKRRETGYGDGDRGRDRARKRAHAAGAGGAEGWLHRGHARKPGRARRPHRPRDRAARRPCRGFREGGQRGFRPPQPRTAEIGRAHVCTPVTHAHLVCRLLLENNNKDTA